MTYSCIMVHMVVGSPNQGVLRVAAGLARRMKASVLGIAASAPMPVVYSEGYSNAGAIQADLAALIQGTDEAEGQFRAAMVGSSGNVTWRSMIQDVPLSDYVAREASAADLIVTGPQVGWFTPNSSHCLLTGDLVLKAGRPVLIASETADEPDLDDVVVAWKDTREARRAIADALPLLKQAGRVCVVEIASADKIAHTQGRLANLEEWLRHHGVASESLAIAATGDDAAQLRAIAEDRRAGVIVAGAYGHDRLREWAFGGVTRDLLLRPHQCSFVSH